MVHLGFLATEPPRNPIPLRFDGRHGPHEALHDLRGDAIAGLL